MLIQTFLNMNTKIFIVKSYMAKYLSILTAVLGLITVDNNVASLGRNPSLNLPHLHLFSGLRKQPLYFQEKSVYP